MALTKISGSVIKDSVSLSGNVSVGGTLTYEDVTNIDAIGIVTARSGIKVLAGGIIAVGVTTATTFSGSGASLTNLPAANLTGTLPAISGANLTNLNASAIASGTVPTARLGSGTANSSTFLAGDSTFKTVTGTTINNNADNRIITGSGTANTLNGESGLTYDGSSLKVGTAVTMTSAGAGFHAGIVTALGFVKTDGTIVGGAMTGYNNPPGVSNVTTFIAGRNAGKNIQLQNGDGTSAIGNILVGDGAGRNAQNQYDYNVTIGSYAHSNLRDGSYNVTIGYRASPNVSTQVSSNTIAIGYETLANFTGGGGFANNGNNVVIGHAAADTLVTGGYNLVLGYGADVSASTTTNEVTIGGPYGTSYAPNHFRIPGIGVSFSEGGAVISGIVTATNFVKADGSAVGGVTSDAQRNTVGGTNAGDSFTGTDATDNTIFGYNAGTSLTTGDKNVIIGSYAGLSATTIGNFVAIGNSAYSSCVTNNGGSVAIGRNALQTYTGGFSNVAIGQGAGQSMGSSGGQNTLVGDNAGYGCKGFNSVIVGFHAGSASNTQGGETIIGMQARYFGNNKAGNTAVGKEAMKGVSGGNGSHTTAIGYEALKILNNGGNQNTALGYQAGDKVNTGTSNVIIGYSAASTGTNDLTNGSNNIIIGSNAAASSATVSNEVTIGDANITKLRIPGINVTLKDNGGTPTNGHVLTVDANGEAGFAAASGGGVTSDGSQNTVGGSNAGDSIVSGGTENTVFGYNAGTAISTGDNNTFFGSRSGRSVSINVNNTGVGYNVMGNASGSGNAAVGRDAGNGMGDGINHVAIGYAAFSNTNQIGTQQNNIVIGYSADVSSSTVSNEVTIGDTNITKFRVPGINFILKDNGGTPTQGHVLTVDANGEAGFAAASGGGGIESDAQRNTVGGTNAGDSFSGTDATDNTILGYDAGTSLTTGDKNVIIGAFAAKSLTTVGNVVAIGHSAYSSQVSSNCCSVVIGHNALQTYTGGFGQVAIGKGAGQSAGSSGGNNTLIGENAGYGCKGFSNTIVGYHAGSASNTQSGQTIIGHQAHYNGNNKAGNTAVGKEAMMGASGGNGAQTTAIGYEALKILNNGGNQNTALGYQAGDKVNTGTSNVIIGYSAASTGTNDLTNGSNNIIIGSNAAASSATVSNEVTIGDANITKLRIPGINVTLKDNGGTPTNGHVLTVDANGEAGFAAASGGGVTSDGSQNTVGGSNAGDSIVSGGTENTVFGYNAGTAISTGDNNTFFGSRAGRSISTGLQNTGVGYNVMGNASGTGNAALGQSAGNGMSSGSYNVALGWSCFSNVSSNGSNNIVIGKQAEISATNVSNEITLGNDDITKLRIPGLNFAIDDGGRVLVNGENTGSSSPDGFNSLLQVNSGNHEGSITIGRHTANSNGPALLFQKSRSGSATPGNGVLSNNDTLGVIRFYGSDGTDRNSFAANIGCEVDGSPGGNDMPGRLIFSTTADGAATSTERLRITSSGKVGINEDNPQTTLNVRGCISTGRNVARELGTIIDISSNYSGGRNGASVINGQKNYEENTNADWITANGQRVNANLTIDLGAQYTCDRFVIYNQNEYTNNVREVKRFTLEGSNDKSSWTTLLDDECGASYAHEPNPGFSFRIPSDFTDDDEGATYRYWRFTMKNFHGSTTLGGVMELELYEVDSNNKTISEISTHHLSAQDISAQNIYHDLPAFFACKTSSLSISNQTNTVLAFTTDQGPGFDTTNGDYQNNNYRFNPKIPGYYQINMCCSVSYGALQAGQIYIYKNGSAYAFSQLYLNGGDSYDDICLTISTLVHLDGQSDYLEARAWRNGGNGGLGSGFQDQQWSGYLVRHAGYRRHGDGV